MQKPNNTSFKDWQEWGLAQAPPFDQRIKELMSELPEGEYIEGYDIMRNFNGIGPCRNNFGDVLHCELHQLLVERWFWSHINTKDPRFNANPGSV